MTFANYGLISETPNSSDFFIDKAQEFVRSLWTFIPPSRTQRFGVRTYQIIPDNRSLEVLVKHYKSKFLLTPEKKLSSFKGNLVDIGIALNFTEDLNSKKSIRFNISTGAMLKDQAKQFFNDASLIPEVGVFSDTDFFIENPSQLSSFKQKDFLELVTQGVEKAETVQEAVTEIINSKSDK